MLVTTTMRKTTSVIHRTRRKRSVEKISLSRGAKGIAASSHGVDQGLLGAAVGTFIEFGAQAIDVHLDDVGGAFPVGFPQALAEHLARDDLAGMAHEHFEDAEFGG